MTEPTEEQNPKSYVLGTISIDEHGKWHVHYIGPYKIGKHRKFGNWHEGSKNVLKLMALVAVRLMHAKAVYLNKIGEVKSEQPTDSNIGL